MSTKPKFLSVLLCVAIAATALVGCTNTATNNSTESSVNSSSEVSSETTSTTESSSEETSNVESNSGSESTPEIDVKTSVEMFENNCKIIVSAYAMYQATHEGEQPDEPSDLDEFIEGGMQSLANLPEGAVYMLVDGYISATYTDAVGEVHEFTYPVTVSYVTGDELDELIVRLQGTPFENEKAIIFSGMGMNTFTYTDNDKVIENLTTNYEEYATEDGVTFYLVYDWENYNIVVCDSEFSPLKVCVMDSEDIFDINCWNLVNGLYAYQQEHNGHFPNSVDELDEYIEGGFNSLQDIPTEATYTLSGWWVTGKFADELGELHDFVYPEDTYLVDEEETAVLKNELSDVDFPEFTYCMQLDYGMDKKISYVLGNGEYINVGDCYTKYLTDTNVVFYIVENWKNEHYIVCNEDWEAVKVIRDEKAVE